MSTARRIVTAVPENSETPLDAIRGWVTPTRLFFVRNHFDIPTIDARAWRLTVEGCVDRPTEWTWDELSSLPQRTVLATVECAGNGRSFLKNRMDGVQWGAGAIAHAEWTGVPLPVVLKKAGVRPEAIEIVVEGTDQGNEPDHPETMHFARSLPLDKAFHNDTLVALQMNGEPLEPIHGFPARLLVPGWYGVASVKWLQRIEAISQPFHGYFQRKKYTVKRQTGTAVETVCIQGMAVKSAIVKPRADENLHAGAQRVFGVAWAGEDQVVRVEVSTDGGSTWADAELLGPHAPYSWTLWEFRWEVDHPGRYSVLARATSSRGAIQPREHDPLNGGYMISFSLPVSVQVTVAGPAAAAAWDSQAVLYDMNAFAESNASLPLDVHLEYSLGAGI